MILMFMSCFSIISEDFETWKNTQSMEETGVENLELPQFGISEDFSWYISNGLLGR